MIQSSNIELFCEGKLSTITSYELIDGEAVREDRNCIPYITEYSLMEYFQGVYYSFDMQPDGVIDMYELTSSGWVFTASVGLNGPMNVVNTIILQVPCYL